MIKKNYLRLSNFIVVALIIVIATIILFYDANYYQILGKRQIENDVNMAAVNVVSDIELFTQEQRTVASVLARDPYIINFLQGEDSSQEQIDTIASYLNSFKTAYEYDVTFLVSAATSRYYYDGGLNKIISPDSEFDSWYYNFVDLDQDYDIQIDRDETNKFAVSVFVNYRVVDDQGKLLGVIGSAKRFDNLSTQIAAYEDEYDLQIYITNIGNAHNSYHGSTDFYKPVEEIAELLEISEDELRTLDQNKSVSYVQGNTEKCVVARHLQAMNWDVIVEKDTVSLRDSFIGHIRSNNMIGIALTLILAVCAFLFIRNSNRAFERSQNIDELTQLPNRRLFEQLFRKEIKSNKLLKHHQEDFSFFILDIDNFKNFNDTLGHLYGNAVLQLVGSNINEMIGAEGIVCRWGGDEFVGVIRRPIEEASQMIGVINYALSKENTQMKVSCSIGVTSINPGDNLEMVTARADEALYQSKTAGKGRYTIKI